MNGAPKEGVRASKTTSSKIGKNHFVKIILEITLDRSLQ
jgi:hypothetical protein